jgi:hypothetical protein
MAGIDLLIGIRFFMKNITGINNADNEQIQIKLVRFVLRYSS